MNSISWNSNIWFSPKYAINYFWNIARKEGNKSIKLNQYKKEREAWIVSVMLLAINIDTNKYWYLQIPEDDPPDISCMTVIKGVIEQQDVEVMEITKQSLGSISEEVKKKLKNKVYPKRYVLIIYLRRAELIKNPIELAKKLSNIVKNKMSAVWLMGSTSPTKHDHVMLNLYPRVERYDLNIIKEFEKLPRVDVIRMYRSTKRKVVKLKTNKNYKFVP